MTGYKIAVLTLFLFLSGCTATPKKDINVIKAPVSENKNSQILTDSASLNLKKLAGKWLREDGDYTLEIFSSTDDGKLDAAYFNPSPIHVEKSEWITRENRLLIRVILRDVNYPGSTYTLEYTPSNDILSGIYYQAVEGASYDVLFRRKNK